jgi:CO/xanthine dehydrogenase Mo-binding subunit
MPGMLWGKALRSPHPHAKIVSINTDKAAAVKGVKAVMTGADLADFPVEKPVMVGLTDMRWVSRNIMARDKVLYAGHAVDAVAAISPRIAEEALELIEVEDAMVPDAPVLHDFIRTAGVEPKPETASNIASRVQYAVGDVAAGFAAADVIVERDFKTAPVHHGYIEPHACVVSLAKDGQATIWSSSQGQFMVRNATAKLTGMSLADIKAIPSEIGCGFGGKTIVYLEPLAMVMARKSGYPVKMQMTREEVFHATGPTSGSVSTVKVGAAKDGTITAIQTVFKFQSGAFQGSPVGNACRYGIAAYDIENAEVAGYDVVCNRPKTNAYRAPGAPIGCFSVESALDDLAIELGMGPLALWERMRLSRVLRRSAASRWGRSVLRRRSAPLGRTRIPLLHLGRTRGGALLPVSGAMRAVRRAPFCT